MTVDVDIHIDAAVDVEITQPEEVRLHRVMKTGIEQRRKRELNGTFPDAAGIMRLDG
jgi:hypothetical protein